jgi:hypothetical protein
MTKLALLVAVDQYADGQFQALRAPDHDSQGLADVLSDEEVGAFEVSILHNELKHDVGCRIEEFLAGKRPDDLLLLYFSCHGVKDAGGRLHLAMADTRFGRFASTAISAAWLAECIRETRARRVLLFLDCCFSGTFDLGMTARSDDAVHVTELEGQGRVVITASSATEYSFEGGSLLESAEKTSVFTGAVIEGLESGKADLDGDGRITVQELYDFVHERVREKTPRQTPHISSADQFGEIQLAQSRLLRSLSPRLRELLVSTDPADRGLAVHSLDGLLASGGDERTQRAARGELARLVQDDSRHVSDLARAALSRTLIPPLVQDGADRQVPPPPPDTPSDPTPAGANGEPPPPSTSASGILAVLAGCVVIIGLVVAATQPDGPYLHEFLYPNTGIYTAAAVAFAAIGDIGAGLLLLGSRRERALLGGLLIGLGATLLLHVVGDFLNERAGTASLAIVAAGAIVGAVAGLRARLGVRDPRTPARPSAVAFIGVGAVAMFFASFLPYNRYFRPTHGWQSPSVWSDNGFRLIEIGAVVLTAAIAAVALSAGTPYHATVTGLLLGGSIISVGTWMRYVGVPAAMPPTYRQSTQIGGWLGLAGATLVLIGSAMLAANALRVEDAGEVDARRARPDRVREVA